MPEFSTDWSDSIAHWPDLLDQLGVLGLPARFLEIGCFEGRTTRWLAEATNPASRIFAVDPFDVRDGQRERFEQNLADYLASGKVSVIEGSSENVLHWLYADGERFDFIYVDGSHRARDVLSDAVLAWPLLSASGSMVFDDYYWPEMPELESPGVAVDAFVRCYGGVLAGERCGRDQYLVRRLA